MKGEGRGKWCDLHERRRRGHARGHKRSAHLRWSSKWPSPQPHRCVHQFLAAPASFCKNTHNQVPTNLPQPPLVQNDLRRKLPPLQVILGCQWLFPGWSREVSGGPMTYAVLAVADLSARAAVAFLSMVAACMLVSGAPFCRSRFQSLSSQVFVPVFAPCTAAASPPRVCCSFVKRVGL